MKIEKASLHHLPAIMNLTRACASDMIARHIFQWNEHYPSREVFEEDIIREHLYIATTKDSLMGCIAIGTLKDPFYENVKWITSDSRHFYIHRLAVHPHHQRKGIASRLMDVAEVKARQEGIASIRLDTFSQNPGNQRFYEQRGYRRLGEIFFPKQSEHPFYCYEFIL